MTDVKKYNLIVDGFSGENFAAIVHEPHGAKVVPFSATAAAWAESFDCNYSEFSIEANLPDAMFVSEEKTLTHTAEAKIKLMSDYQNTHTHELPPISKSLNVKSFLSESTRADVRNSGNVYGMQLSSAPKASKKKIINFKASKAKASSSAISMLAQAKKSKFRKAKNRERFTLSNDMQHVSPFHGYASKSLERRVGKAIDSHLVANSGNRASRRSSTLLTKSDNARTMDLSKRISTVIKFKANRFS